MRLFTAIELPEAVRSAIHAATAPHLRGVAGCRPVPPENLHVTVRFLGEVAPERLPEIAGALRSAASSALPARLRTDGFGAFPHLRRPRVVWVGIEDPGRRTTALERAVTAALEPLGFPPEDREWTPHVTVARLGDPRKFGARARAFVLPPEPAPGPWFDADSLTLFQSELGPRGPTYRVAERFPLSVSGRDPDSPVRPGPAEDRPPPP